jgi:hypothetical protein
MVWRQNIHLIPHSPQAWWPGSAWWLSGRGSNFGSFPSTRRWRKIIIVYLEHHLDLMIFQAASWATCNPKCNPNNVQWLLVLRRFWKQSRLRGWEESRAYVVGATFKSLTGRSVHGAYSGLFDLGIFLCGEGFFEWAFFIWGELNSRYTIHITPLALVWSHLGQQDQAIRLSISLGNQPFGVAVGKL